MTEQLRDKVGELASWACLGEGSPGSNPPNEAVSVKID